MLLNFNKIIVENGFVLLYVFHKFFVLKLIFLPCIYGFYLKKNSPLVPRKDTEKFTNLKFYQSKY